jgi:hypothetical protein
MPLESRLEELIEADTSILGRPLMVIGRQVPTPYGKFIDLLGIDADGALHVLELKRDRTPRDVVAQVLDYATWVQDIANDEIRDIHAEYVRRRGQGAVFDEAFAEHFGASPPDDLNTAHTLTVVASEMDAATERMVTYLSSGYGVPLNVLFFRYFEDDGRSYLARTWLIEDASAAPASGGTIVRRTCSVPRAIQRSVARGCPVPAKVIQQVSRAVSARYQMRPPPVTSICHCSQVCPRWVPCARLPFSWWCRGVPVVGLGSVRMVSQAR